MSVIRDKATAPKGLPSLGVMALVILSLVLGLHAPAVQHHQMLYLDQVPGCTNTSLVCAEVNQQGGNP